MNIMNTWKTKFNFAVDPFYDIDKCLREYTE